MLEVKVKEMLEANLKEMLEAKMKEIRKAKLKKTWMPSRLKHPGKSEMY